MKGTQRILIALLALPTLALAQSNTIRLGASPLRSSTDVGQQADKAVRSYALRYEAFTGFARRQRMRDLGRPNTRVILPPVRVLIPNSSVSTQSITGGDINLVFDATGDRAFPDSYQTFLQNVFDKARATMNVVFGPPAEGGDVHVANYDADIGDRDAVAGGYYLPDNGSGKREIRFPVYNNPETAAVNFVHTLLLAYQGTKVYRYDAFEEGLVRAATMKIVRIPAAMPGQDQDQIAYTLESSYEAGPWYDWYNQRSLGGSRFIAPNLRSIPLPAGGSVGGLYLMRYLMAGSAWEKVLVEYPTFIAEFNKRVYAQPALRSDVAGLIALGQTVLNALRPGNPTIEGMSFADWYRHQFILETHDTSGLKLHVAPVPITSGLSGQDFGVFDFPTTFFYTETTGNERLLDATSYPIFWAASYDRLFPSAQDEKMDIAASYGSVTPNFPDENAGKPYRVAVDVPVWDQLVRVHVPAGAVATAEQTAPNDLYGTVEGVVASTGVTFSVRAKVGSTVVATAPVSDGAFGKLIDTDLWQAPASVLLDLLRTDTSGTTVVYSRRVNKAPGALAVDLRVGGEATIPISLFKGINLSGFPVDPFESWNPNILNLNADQTLIARWNSWNSASYDLFPSVEPFKIGHAYFIRMPADRDLDVPGYTAPNNTPWSVGLKPGWNMVSPPLNATVSTDNVLVVRGTSFPTSWTDARGVDIGLDFYQFQRGNLDPVSGAPETGSYVAADKFQPIRGYFVQCLAAEGATLTFFPSPQGSAAKMSTASIAPLPDWKLRVSAIEGTKKTEAILAQSKTATNGFDSREDSALPPSIGGFQASSNGLYRDTRADAPNMLYSVRLDGLRVGTRYSVTLKVEKGRYSWLGVSRDGGTYKRIDGERTITFTASTSSSTLSVKVNR